MPDIGFGEIVVIIVIALLVFGPDRLPKMAADAARTLRQVRRMAASARKDLVDAAGLEGDGEMAQTMKDLRDLDPRQAMKGALTDDPAAGGAAGGAASAGRAGRKPRTASGTSSLSASAKTAPQTSGQAPVTGAASAGGAAGGAASASGAGGNPTSGPGDAAAPVAPPVITPAEVDPDWT